MQTQIAPGVTDLLIDRPDGRFALVKNDLLPQPGKIPGKECLEDSNEHSARPG